MYGWAGTVLRVNLSKGTITKEPLNVQYVHEYIGQRGLAVKYHFDECDHHADPLGLGNNVVMMTGPLTGLLGVCSGQFEVVAKSPLSGGLGCGSSGGHFGAEMKFAGYDGIIFEGQATNPVFLYVRDDTVELRPADKVWGKTVSQTTEYLQKICNPKARVCCIGPASESLSLLGCVMSDKRHFKGGTGLGAVMGSKNLKGIVVRGTDTVKIAHPEEYMKKVMIDRQAIQDNTFSALLGNDKISNVLHLLDAMKFGSQKILRTGQFDGKSTVYPEEIQKCSLNNRVSCFSCPVGCRHIASIREGLYKGTGEGLSYEVGWAFGSNCGVSRLDAIVYANWLCAEYGLDPVSCGATIACAMELADIGVVSQSEIGIDRPLRRGDAEAMVELTCLAGQARGFGKAIGKGSYRLAKAYSHPEFAMCCKKQEIPPFGIHVLRDFGLHIATSNDGGRYIVGYLMKNYLNGFSAERVKSMQDELALLESSGLCIFSNTVMETSRLVEHLSLATGIPFTETYGRLVGERIWNLERLYDLTGDFEGDTLPQQLMEEVSPMSDGTYFSTRFHAQLKQYYDARGWNGKGIPTKERKEILHL